MLSQHQIEFFEQNGYLVVDDLLGQPKIDAIKNEYSVVLAELCDLWIGLGYLEARVKSLNFYQQLQAIIDAGLDYFQPLDISLPLEDIYSDTPIHLGTAVFDMMTNNHLLDTVESLIGPEITSNPIQHVRIKPPMNRVADGEGRAHIVKTDWHQDRAVALEEADKTKMVTVWLAINDATVDNGCLQVIPGSHRESMQPHCPQSHQLGIPEKVIDVNRTKALPVKAGGAVLFHPLTVHSSLDNISEEIRWSFDIRFSVTGQLTGRPVFPEFVARSRRDPESELRDAERWAESWRITREKLAKDKPDLSFHRWDGSHNVCA